MKWGVRRYQNPDGTLTAAGKARYKSADGDSNYRNKDGTRTMRGKVETALSGGNVPHDVEVKEAERRKKNCKKKELRYLDEIIGEEWSDTEKLLCEESRKRSKAKGLNEEEAQKELKKAKAVLRDYYEEQFRLTFPKGDQVLAEWGIPEKRLKKSSAKASDVHQQIIDKGRRFTRQTLSGISDPIHNWATIDAMNHTNWAINHVMYNGF